MSAQPDIFGFEKPKAKLQIRAHIVDAGCGMTKAHIGLFRCRLCGTEGWYEFDTVSEGKKGIPCPNCNTNQ